MANLRMLRRTYTEAIDGHEIEDWLEAEYKRGIIEFNNFSNPFLVDLVLTVFDMKRNSVFKSPSQDKLIDHKQCVAFHEAGHATAIYLNNKARNLPPVFFQIMFKDLNSTSEENLIVYQVMHDYIAKVKGGRSIKSLAHANNALVDNNTDRNDSMMSLIKDQLVALEVDIINLLIGPLAEAKHIADTDDELFNHKLVNLKALKNYGGSSDLERAHEYLQSFSACKQQQGKKLEELFTVAFNFVNDRANWAAITKLAHYILDSNKNIIDCEEVVSLLEH